MYNYRIGGKKGKKISLSESKNRVVVRTRNARKLEDAVYSSESREALKDFRVEMEFPEADVTVLQTKEKMPATAVKRDRARAALKKEPELRFAGRVLMDEKSHEPVLYTENLFVKFHDRIPEETCLNILAEYALIVKQQPGYARNSFFVQAPEDTGLKIFELAETILQRKEVEFCHPELVRQKSRKKIHPEQWHLHKTMIRGKRINAHVSAQRAHQLTEGQNIVIAVIDDGVDIDHIEFRIPGKVIHGRDATRGSHDPRPKTKEDTHGTPCAGVATASGIKASGVAPKATLMPIRLSSNLGSMHEASAFSWAVDHGADVISCSWGPEDGYWWEPGDARHTQWTPMPDSTRLAIEYAVTRGRKGKGCVIFFAAGNGNEDLKYDGYASCPMVMAVAACNDTNKRSVYSDYGKAVWCCFPSDDEGYPPFGHPDPRTKGIYTTDRSGEAGDARGHYIRNFGGTSSACPGAAGTAALILSVNPALTWQQVRSIIRLTAEKIDRRHGRYDSRGHSHWYGYGKVDAEKAVHKAIAMQKKSPRRSKKKVR